MTAQRRIHAEVRIKDAADTITPAEGERLSDRAGFTLIGGGVTATFAAAVENLTAGRDTLIIVEEDYRHADGGRAYALDVETALYTEQLGGSLSFDCVARQHHTGGTEHVTIKIKADAGRYLVPFLGQQRVTLLVDEGLLYASNS